jgi:hypothetical protein
MTTSPDIRPTIAPICDATRRIEQTLHEIVLQRTRGVFDLGRLAAALKGESCECHPTAEIPDPDFNYTRSPYSPPFIGRAVPQ